MIRRRHGNDFLLFTQNDHAVLSGRLAERFGSGGFARPEPHRSVIDAVSMHDAGWVLHDRMPTLNKDGFPLHVFETPPRLSTRLWSESVRLASEKDAYTGLLVSIHVLWLSGLVQKTFAAPARRRAHPQETFALNKFQHRQIEIQEDLRRRLALRIDLPLEMGLAEAGRSPDEDRLLANYALLRATDQLTLDLLCDGHPFKRIDGLRTSKGKLQPLTVERPTDFSATLNPWPFDATSLDFSIPFKRVPARKWESDLEFQTTYEAVGEETMAIRIGKGN